MPVTEINKKLQEQAAHNQVQQQQQQQQSNQLNSSNHDNLDSTNSLIDSLTTQEQQQQLFNKLQQLQQQKDKDFVSDDELNKNTDNSSFMAQIYSTARQKLAHAHTNNCLHLTNTPPMMIMMMMSMTIMDCIQNINNITNHVL